LEAEVGPPILRAPGGKLFPTSASPDSQKRFTKIPALIDTGASRTVVTPEVVKRLGLRKIDETQLRRVGGINENAEVYVAALQFPRYKLATIEIIEVVCCELPQQVIQCLLGRDVLPRWVFTYDGTKGNWGIEEEDVAYWVDPPTGIDT
jgi:predicted aspartyl protease